MTLPYTICPVCQAAVSTQDDTCDACGLLLTSYQPTASIAWAHAPLKPFDAGWQLANGRYTIRRQLSSGGMGNLFLASDHRTFDRLVVIKVLQNYFNAADPQKARDRFIDEARTLATLKHPAVPQIYSYFQDGTHACIVMEHIAGHDLDQGLSRNDKHGNAILGNSYPRHDVVRWGVEVCRILEYLHSRQPLPVIHHDIKPSNLLRDNDSGMIRLVDFGTAGNTNVAGYGTPGYAPREQYQGISNPRSDVYALAATLYHLASDDDPSLHPFSFPQLASLGILGGVLQPALQDDVAARPDVVAFRKQLEPLLHASMTHAIQMPNGNTATDILDISRWCEHNWKEATNWLYTSMPSQIELHFGQAELAEQLRKITHTQRDRDAGLDSALAMIDPHDFGAAQPRLHFVKQSVDFGAISRYKVTSLLFTVVNDSRRCVDFTLRTPRWVKTDITNSTLPPGDARRVHVDTNPSSITARGQLQGDLRIVMANVTLIQIPIFAIVSGPRVMFNTVKKFFRDRPYVLILIALLLWFVLMWMGPTLYNSYFTSSYTHHGASTAAPSESVLVAQQPDTGPAPIEQRLLPISETLVSRYAREAVAARTAEQWERAAKAIVALEALDSDKEFAHLSDLTDAPLALINAVEQARVAGWYHDNLIAVYTFQLPHSSSSHITFSPDGQALAAYNTQNNTIEVLEATDGQPFIKLPQSSFSALAYSPDNHYIVASGIDSLTFWDVNRTSPVQKALINADWVNHIMWSPDRETLATIGDDGTIRLWRVHDGAMLYTIVHAEGTHDRIRVAFSPDSRTLASVGNDKTIKLWRVEDGTLLRTLPLESSALDIAFAPDGQTLIAASGWNLIIWPLAASQPSKSFPQSNLLDQIAVSPDGQLIASKYGLIRLSDGATVSSFPSDIYVQRVAWSSDGQSLLSISGIPATTITVWKPLPADSPIFVR